MQFHATSNKNHHPTIERGRGWTDKSKTSWINGELNDAIFDNDKESQEAEANHRFVGLSTVSYRPGV